MKLAALAVIIVGVPLYIFIFHHEILEDASNLRNIEHWLLQYRGKSALVYIGAQILQIIICVIPGQALQVAAGYLYGFWLAYGLSMIGALLGFLIYNANPAKVFMGDTGSLALGGFITAMAYLLQLPLFIPIVGFIYFIEVVSVIIQVAYFKKTHGKRIFRMAPIHHHFELGGWSEVKVVAVFTIVTVILSTVALLGLWA